MNCAHHWYVDDKSIGVCRKCGEIRDFGKLYRQWLKSYRKKNNA